ncbi:MAG: LON peptidase substrate-binding domain-containing protein, partial [Chloroflexota bacterium]|nr:LON peptidase substrate-binding domain-containing protein [Chloroflexota bacterium]
MPAGPSTKKSTARGRSPESTPAGATPRDDDQRLAATGAEATAEVPAREDEPVATVPSGAEPGVEPGATSEAKPKAKRKPRGRARTKLGPEISLPVLVVDETALLPHMSIPFPIEDDESAMVIDRAMRTPSRLVLVLTERPVPPVSAAGDEGGPDPIRDGEFRELVADAVAETLAETLGVTLDAADRAEAELADSEDPAWTPDEAQPVEEYELAPVGVIAEVGQRIARPGGGHAHVILQGQARGVVTKILQEQPYVAARVRRQDDPVHGGTEGEAAMSAVLEQVETYISMLPNVPEEVLTMIRGVDEPGWLADLIAFSPEFSSEQRQELLEVLDPVKRLRRLSVIVQKRLNVLNLRRQIQHEAQAGMDKQQREYFLREQMRAIQKELGDGSAEETLANELRQKIEAAGMPDLVKEKALIQVERLEQQHPFSPEIGVIRSYLEWLTELPWAIETADRLDLNEAAAILDRDHHGLEKVKERIIEYIAVRKLAGDKLRAPIICFVGPPGVGKTSLGRSIAEAIGRNYVRMSLGGVRDEAEIRGHRRTYVGAMPGRVVKSLRDAKSRNPVLVLDEIDKVGSDAYRGDPSSALLEVLDPEQNSAFSDHYLEVPFDLSKVI